MLVIPTNTYDNSSITLNINYFSERYYLQPNIVNSNKVLDIFSAFAELLIYLGLWDFSVEVVIHIERFETNTLKSTNSGLRI